MLIALLAALLEFTVAQDAVGRGGGDAWAGSPRELRVAAIEKARLGGKVAQVEKLVGLLETVAGSRRATDYDLAYANWRLHLLTMERAQRTDRQAAALDNAQALLEPLVEAAPKDVESLILLSAALGARANGAESRVLRSELVGVAYLTRHWIYIQTIREGLCSEGFWGVRKDKPRFPPPPDTRWSDK